MIFVFKLDGVSLDTEPVKNENPCDNVFMIVIINNIFENIKNFHITIKISLPELEEFEPSTPSAKLLHRMVRQHLSAVQEVLAQEGISLEFRHIASYLLWYCQAAINTSNRNSDNESDIVRFKALLHEIIALVGYFAARHQENQTIVQSGHRPSVLEQLCNLPFPYFSQPELKRILFPTLLACCFDNDENRAILQEEMNWQLIDEFLYSPIENGKNEHLSSLVLNRR